MKKLFSLILLILACTAAGFASTITSAGTGNWNTAGTWVGSAVPQAGDDVVIAAGHIVTIDIANAACNNLNIDGSLTFPNATGMGITINGSVAISATGSFNTYQSGNPTGTLIQTITLYGNFTNNGTFDMRRGSSANIGTGTLIFTGNTTSTINLSQAAYSSSLEEFNAVTINKTGGAKVVLASGNLFMANNNSNGPAVLTLTSGIIETGINTWVVLSTASAGVTGSSSLSYINGALGRGGNTSTATTRYFEVGDANGFRPITPSISAGIASGGYVTVRCIAGNANNSSTLNGSLTNVSAVRYYQIGYSQGTGGTTSTGITKSTASYAAGDGVLSGNTDLRVAYSTDSNRGTWTPAGQTTPYTTTDGSTLSTITPDNFTSTITLNSGSSFYLALGSVSGASNPLPVELQSFTAQARNGAVELAWSTATEVNNAGFEIEKLADGAWTSIGFVAGAGTSNSPKQYAFAEKNVASGAYSYRLKQIDRDGKVEYSKSVTVNVVGAPMELSLIGNYPNPFNPATTVKFTVPSEGRAVVKVFNILGKEVAEIFNEAVVSGKLYSASFNASSLPSGIYFSRLEFGGRTMVKKMMLMK